MPIFLWQFYVNRQVEQHYFLLRRDSHVPTYLEARLVAIWNN